MEPNLPRLIEKAKTGDTGAFKEIYHLYYKKIYRYCSFQVQNTEQAADVCQETFIKAWKALPTFTLKNGGTIQAYLFRIARNLIIDASRKKKEFQLAEYTEIETQENFEEDFDRQQNIKNIKRALTNLDEVDRQIVILRYFEEISTEETAKVIGISHGALRVRIHRVLKKLKDILERHEN